MSRTWEELIVIGLLWLVVAVGILPLRLTTWVNNASAAAKMAVLIAAGLVGLVYAGTHGVANPVTAAQLCRAPASASPPWPSSSPTSAASR